MLMDLNSCFIFFIVCFISTHLIRSIFFKSRSPIRLPPGPTALPIIGNFHLLGPQPHRSFYELSTLYGPIYHIRLGSTPVVIVSSPEIAREIFTTHELSFASRPLSIVARYFAYETAGFAFAPYGPYWKFLKKLVMTELLNGRAIDRFLPVRSNELQKFLRYLQKKSELSEGVNVNTELTKLTNNIIIRMAMDMRSSAKEEESEEVRMVARDVAEVMGKFNLSDFFGFLRILDLQGLERRIKSVRKRFDEMMERVIKEHKDTKREKIQKGDEGDGVKDIIDILLDISDDEKSEMRLTTENIKAFIQDIFTAGTDTAAVTIEWALAELINHPTMLKKAREEIDFVVGKSRLVKESDIPNLPYLQAIVKEAMRLHPTVPLIGRQAKQDCKIGDYTIPANAWLFVNSWALGRDSKHWEDPLEFIPSRFMDSKDNNQNKIDFKGQHFHFLPFGSGRRGCPGSSLGIQIVHTTLAAMIQCFEWKLGFNGKETMIDMKEGIGLTIPRENPLICVPVARFNPIFDK